MCIQPAWMIPHADSFGQIGWHWSRVKPVERSAVDKQTGEFFEAFPVGCGKCLECIQLHKIEWVHRIMDEASLHSQNTVVTLTYAEGQSDKLDLKRRDFQLFMKRLRRKVGKCRFYMCGEYGSRGCRPHFHAVLFGVDFPDKYFYKQSKKGKDVFRSPTLEKLWTLGFSSITAVAPESLEYLTKDFQKLLPLDDGRTPPFNGMSNRPGIGAGAISLRSLQSGKIYHNGKFCGLPRYYKRLFERDFPVEFIHFKNAFYPIYQNVAALKESEDETQHLLRYDAKLKKLLDKR